MSVDTKLRSTIQEVSDWCYQRPRALLVQSHREPAGQCGHPLHARWCPLRANKASCASLRPSGPRSKTWACCWLQQLRRLQKAAEAVKPGSVEAPSGKTEHAYGVRAHRKLRAAMPILKSDPI